MCYFSTQGHDALLLRVAAMETRLASVEQQQAAASVPRDTDAQALAAIKTELASLKALQLGRHSFPTLAPSPAIPAWQRTAVVRPAADTSATSAADASATSAVDASATSAVAPPPATPVALAAASDRPEQEADNMTVTRAAEPPTTAEEAAD